ncbi:hypothetical protein TsFJ059_006396 [Trichoderma semiorbis]|uniref:Uncharacterized protein n=4 Tax=Trichoderma TaxID=5543 RepID=A0A9W9B553_9HYPO|nr:hypothetical protein T069G_09342 [Trichoderma breve]KAF3062764.1 hypothetical protein CFAM422_010559 [Trichoderma lentiforme]KAH0522571.1 hypothetical protein TsFJ059_006396 [Trichoderma semiorbis]KAK4072243.1 hypothetical protein Trihar35433_4307 [Trichoderma harzianum]OPB40306.1 hypothetical protein A0O28_0003850 [Trichoderma guizhouense]KAJ4855974.1 hypothetical protein T069G_09342 [Trichoderma breve]
MNRKHSETGITDEAAIEGHDLIHNAEVEEQRAHGDQALTQPDEGDAPLNATKQSEPAMAGQTGRRHSAMDKIKETLHLKK